MIEIYWGSGSPYAWRVLLALTLKKLPYESKLISFAKGEHKTSEFLSMNPRGKVPVLVDGSTTIYESTAILNYLDRAHPEVPIFGKNAAEAAEVYRIVAEHDLYVDHLSQAIVRPLYFGQEKEERDAIIAAHETLLPELARIEGLLEKNPYLASHDPSAADVVTFPTMKALERACHKETAKSFDLKIVPYGERYPRIAAWAERIENWPGYDRTYPPHWRA